MMNRRSLFKGSAAIAAISAASQGIPGAMAAPNTQGGPKRISARGHDGIMDRYPTLDLDSHNDMIAGIRKWNNGALDSAAEARAAEIYNKHGIPLDSDLPMAQVIELVKDDPIIALSGYTWLDVQHIKWKNTLNAFESRADEYLAEMEAFDKAGPGTLELNPNMFIPGYCRMEIHQQPGGYVGNAFAGHIYHYATNVSADRRNDQDQNHMTSAMSTPLPKDGKVKRILDVGTSVGQFATSLKRRFPDAEVWALDVGGPMVRYAHMRAVDMGVAVNFRQALAEDTHFPDNHFDMVVSNIMHHEVTADGTKAIYREAQRILRPGGHYYPIDVYTHEPPPKSAMGKYKMFWTYRWNHEDWWLEWSELDQEAEMKKAGLKVSRTPQTTGGGRRRGNNIVGTKV